MSHKRSVTQIRRTSGNDTRNTDLLSHIYLLMSNPNVFRVQQKQKNWPCHSSTFGGNCMISWSQRNHQLFFFNLELHIVTGPPTITNNHPRLQLIYNHCNIRLVIFPLITLEPLVSVFRCCETEKENRPQVISGSNFSLELWVQMLHGVRVLIRLGSEVRRHWPQSPIMPLAICLI